MIWILKSASFWSLLAPSIAYVEMQNEMGIDGRGYPFSFSPLKASNSAF